MNFLFPDVRMKREESRMIREQLLILVFRALEEKQQYTTAECRNIRAWSPGKWRNYGFLENDERKVLMQGSAGKIPLKLLCVGFYNLCISKSNGCNINSNWLSLLSPEMQEFLGLS